MILMILSAAWMGRWPHSKPIWRGCVQGGRKCGLLEPIQVVDAYGQMMPIAQVGTISVPEPRMLSVQVWDKGQVAMVEKAIRESSLGLNPMAEGQLIRIPLA